VFSKDYRRRRLNGFGLGADLICVVQFKKFGRAFTPDIIGATIEGAGKWRIAWNKKYLDTIRSLENNG
jgi:hypothetical protein